MNTLSIKLFHNLYGNKLNYVFKSLFLKCRLATLPINFNDREVPFKVIDGSLDRNCSEYQRSIERGNSFENHLQNSLKKVSEGGGKRAIQQHILKNNKILPRQRVQELLDDKDDFFDLCNLAGLGMDYGDIPGAGYIMGIGKIHGRYCLICCNDSTFKSGASYPITVTKHLRAQRISEKNRLPCIYLVDSAGAFLPLQSEIFPSKEHGGRVFFNEAVLSADGIPQISVVCGSCTAGGAYVPTMCDEAVMVKKIGTVFLGGPPLVKAATGEIISAEDLGGADLHCRVSGCIDHYAEDEIESYEICRDIVASLGAPNSTHTKIYEEPLFNPDDLLSLSGLKSIKRENVYQILARILDGSRFREFKRLYGCSLVSGFGFIQGQLVGLLSNIGPLECQDAQSGAHFILMCNMRNIPLIFLQNSSASDVINHSTQTGTNFAVLKDRAKMISALSTASVPKITINIGGCYGDDNFTMCGQSFDPNFIFAWPGAETAISWEPADKEINMEENPFSRPTSSFYSCARILNDGVIYPRDTRKVLARCLDIVSSGIPKRNVQLPVLRM